EHLLGTTISRVDLDLPEIQAASLEEVTRAKLDAARAFAPHPVAVEDVSLELDALGGFPGPFVKWLLASAGGDGLSAMVQGLSSNAATARCIVARWDGETVLLAEGSVAGHVLAEPRGSTEFGWDAWFLPEGSSRTYGEMTRDEKRETSHRALAWRRMSRLLTLKP
ncbi:MAG TPA: non-canonical purine NTP pyrophosphatase, partial [Rhodothermales bacterium]|nr:non-canonical purine NTP pyrophosphatase [Rhodothermales bacterium]